MLGTIKKLKDTMTNAQVKGFKEKLGEDRWQLFKNILSCETQEEANEHTLAFKVAISELGITSLLSLHALLDDEQKLLIQDLL